ncbi:phosphatidate cytidylyltransferase [Arachidicoccus rhizosphaerae]|jgi:phosphatidate cytidylyltransferase|uniref:Phosphatidate cytidylyltransferase n=1 Tax=Arachidicoccus rhizosphaerae TaxID=551991 RepID=A0A1H3VNW9_9BACT|nr:phosphatidate cytidylyltransferase [Arachidicoccus rhizosphaerae]SDZ75944.1 phosphatidate cytidylyltransferase [Arachidicoccus rhizosphaerae]
MALNQQVFKTRALTAVIFVVVMLSGLLINQWTFALLFFIIHWGCWTEFDQLLKKIYPDYGKADPRMTSLPRLIGSGFLIFCLPHHYALFGVELYYIGALIMIIGTVKFISLWIRAGALQKVTAKGAVLGLVYISLSWGLMIHLRFCDFLDYPLGWVIALTMVGSVWTNDTMQYVVGSLIGKTPFSSISPNKTLEGTIGGSLICIIVITAIGYYFVEKELWLMFLIVSAVTAVIGTLGDLLESKLKRMAGVKDSGNFMPGHGGFLDRFDSLILATPFVVAIVTCWPRLGLI